MGKVRERKETGKLYLDFFYLGKRCREQTALQNTPTNRRKCEALLRKVEAKILLGEFDYSEFFPGSKNLEKLKQAGVLSDSGASAGGSHGNALDGQQYETPAFDEFAVQWFEENKIHWRTSHQRNVLSILESSLKPAFKSQPIGQITKTDILNARNKLARGEGGGRRTPKTPKTVNSHMAILRSILNEAAERFNFDTPYRNIKPLKLRKTHIEPFSLREVEQILQHVREDYRNYYLVRFYTGMRTGEIDGLKWQYVDFERREILIRETRVNAQTEYTKTDGSQREIAMFGPVYEALREQYKATGNTSEYVFSNQRGAPLEHNNVTKRVWYPLLRSLGLKKRRPYQTRHTAATLLLASGENPEWVAQVLGHSSTEMLFKVYSRYIPNLTRMDGSAFEKLIGRSQAPKEEDGDSEE